MQDDPGADLDAFVQRDVCMQTPVRPDGRSGADDAAGTQHRAAPDPRAGFDDAIGADAHALFDDGVGRDHGGGMGFSGQGGSAGSVEPLRDAREKQVGMLADDQCEPRPVATLGFKGFGDVGRDDDRPCSGCAKLALIAGIGQERDFLRTGRRQGPDAADPHGVCAGNRTDTPVDTLGIGGAQHCFECRRAGKIQ
ncbi:hypothetical protein D3C72_1659870 [compost metagenome]